MKGGVCVCIVSIDRFWVVYCDSIGFYLDLDLFYYGNGWDLVYFGFFIIILSCYCLFDFVYVVVGD